jgi:ABC-2 type transport system permease protein
MRNIWTIARREYKLYFTTPVAYVIAFLFVLVLGLIFYAEITQSLDMAFYQPYTPSMRDISGPIVTLLLFTMPAVTMRLLAEEQRSGTMELMLTAPVREWELVIGKWLGGVLFMITLLGITWIFPIILNRLVDPGIDQGLIVTNYLGLALMASALIAVGLAISSLFSSQVAAFFVSLGFVLFILLTNVFTVSAQQGWGDFWRYLNFTGHFYDTLFQGIIDLRDIVYYLSITALGLFFGTVLIESRRWR